MYIRVHSPNTHIKITSKQKRGRSKKYYVPETKRVIYLLEEFKNAEVEGTEEDKQN